jgi:hydrogenase maturation protease
VDAWICEFSHLLSKNYGKCVVHLVPLGNSLKRDDGVGIYILNRLRKMLKNNHPSYIKIHAARLSVETIMQRIPSQDTVIFFDAVMTNYKPGTIIFTNLSTAKFGFFATHNIPLKVLLEYRLMLDNSYLLGVVPYDLSVGEGLSPFVKTVADYIVDELYRIVRCESHD